MMKVSRMIQIITILLNKKTITAAELAERFGVSTRTIYRDIDALSASGVPVYSMQGVNGGISILENYSVNRAMLSDNDKNSILFALNSLQSTKYPEIDEVLEKLGGIFKNNVSDWISVDFSPWGANPNAYNKFVDIKAAILQCRVIEIDYINAQNERSTRKIEPSRLVFKSQAWYLWGYCKAKQDYRTFRISRIKKVVLTDEAFDRNNVHIATNDEHVDKLRHEPKLVHLVLEFTAEASYRLCDDYDDDQLVKLDNGNYRLELDFPKDEWVYGYILSFGCFVKVIEPAYIRDIINEKARKIVEFYK